MIKCVKIYYIRKRLKKKLIYKITLRMNHISNQQTHTISKMTSQLINGYDSN